MAEVLLAEVTRGPSVESRHFGAAVAVGPSGVEWRLGELGRPVFPRSAIKAIQALQLIESGAADRYGLGDREIALACASHSAEPVHVELAENWLARLGLGEPALCCGAHWPYSEEATRALAAEGRTPSSLHNNCSGKHVGFLNVARHLGEPVEDYVARDHPTQVRWLDALEELSGETLEARNAGIDGCAIPSQPLSLTGLATAFQHMATGDGLGPARQAAVQRINRAIAAHPQLVAGTGRMCSRIIAATGGRVLAKTGAEGVYGAWIPEAGLGLALKVSDGATRASEVAVIALLRRALGPGHELSALLAPLGEANLLTSRGVPAGAVRAAAGLDARPIAHVRAG